MKHALLLAGICCFLIAAMPHTFASGEDKVGQAIAASQAWMAQIDAGKYDESYDAGCGAMHDKVPQDRWTLVLKSIRGLYGPVVSRTQVSHVYKPDGYEGSEGEFMVVTYESSFKKLGPATETIVLKWEDGKWLGAGYNANPKSSADASSVPSPVISSEVHTDANVTPPTPKSQNP